MELQAFTWKCNGLQVIRYITFVTLHAWLHTNLYKPMETGNCSSHS